jgi:hypothetical protein
MKHLPHSSLRPLLFFAVVFTMLASLWSSQIAFAQELQWKGRIDAMPASGLQGEWIVAGRAFAATAGTEFRTDKGPFAVGVCVEVEYVGAAQPFTATKIASKSSDDCTSGTATPGVTPSETPGVTPSETPGVTPSETPGVTPSETPGVTPSQTPSVTPSETPGAEREAYGLVQVMPASGFLGDWVIGGVAYTAPAGAEFKQRSGPLVVGACAKIHYSGAAAPFTAREIESRAAADCNGTIPPTPGATTTPGVTATPGVTGTPGVESEIYGRIDSFPAALIGEWVVDGIAYNAPAGAEFKQEDGAFAVGVCVKIHANPTTTPATIREIETEREYRCSGDDQNGGSAGEGEVYGILQSFPAGLTGAWNVAGLTFTADSATEFKQRNGAFAVGGMVKVHFIITTAGDFYAREIETKGGDDHRGGHVYGIVDSIPDGRVGVWRIGGIDYVATNTTRYEETQGVLTVGARVRVKYALDNAGQRVAQKIETTTSTGGADDPSHLKVFGFVNQMPASGLVGAWTIDNVVYTTTTATKFNENDGVIGVGAYVAVEYRVQNGANVVHEIEVKVPPGAGAQVGFGVIDDKGGATTAAVAANEMWRIGGVVYTVTPATDLDDLESALGIGNTALVNSYTAADGAQVATQIRGATLTSTLYLPNVRR